MLILHIGRHKTGTSSIQHFLHDNREELKARGVIYPRPVGAAAAHHGIALALAASRDMTKYQLFLKSLRPLEQTVVLSSEGFQRLLARQANQFFAPYRRDMRAVTYLREQFSYAWSSYCQNVLANIYAGPFDTALREYRPKYLTFLKRWSVVTCGNLTVRIFDRNKMIDGDVVADFCDTALAIRAAAFPSAKVVNETLGWRAVNFARAVNSRIADRSDTAAIKPDLLQGLRAVAEVYPELKEKPTFAPDFIEGYQVQFVDENRLIAQEFFGSPDEPLFDLSWRGDSDWNSHESLTRRHIDALYEHYPSLIQIRDVIGSAVKA